MPESTKPYRSLEGAGGKVPVYWRIEGSLLDLGALRQVGFFTWNARSFDERWKRRAMMAAHMKEDRQLDGAAPQ